MVILGNLLYFVKEFVADVKDFVKQSNAGQR
jgi:hypothetical protein